MGNFHSNTTKSEGEFIVGRQSNASQLFWANYDLVHEIMDFMRTFGEIAIIPRICKTTSDSLFSYRFKDREEQKCDRILFLRRAETYYEAAINSQFRTWYGRKIDIPESIRPNNHSRLISMQFHSLSANLEYIGKSEINALLGCKELKFKNFKLSQLIWLCESNIPLLAHTLELQVDPIIFTQTFDKDTRSLEMILPNVTKIIINGGSSASSFVEIAMMLARIPSLRSLDLSQYYIPPELASLLPNSLTELVILTGCNHAHYRNIDLSSLAELRKLRIVGEWYYQDRQLSMIFPGKLEHLTISRLNWGINQLIPNSVKTLSCSDDNSHMKNAIEKSSVENLILFGIAPWWWEDFKLPPNLRVLNMICERSSEVRLSVNDFPDSLTELYITCGNIKLCRGMIPPNLRNLSITADKLYIFPYSIPDSVTSLHIPSYTGAFERNVLPSNLTYLRVGAAYETDDALKSYFPSTLFYIHCLERKIGIDELFEMIDFNNTRKSGDIRLIWKSLPSNMSRETHKIL